MTTFSELALAEPILRAVHTEGYTQPTPIQAQAIPPILAGKDLLGCAQTGTGKTAAFALPILQRIMYQSTRAPGARPHVRALILSPTRELASQIAESFRVYGKNTGVRYATVFGGVGQHGQVSALRSGVDVLVATPGRLLDLMNQRLVDLRNVEVFVLDEADRMLDMGFVHDIRRVIAVLPANRQSLMFSATMPREIRKLADTFLKHPVSVEITPVATTVEKIEQFVYHVKREQKADLLVHLLNSQAVSRMLIFSRTKHGADRLVRKLHTAGIHAAAIHGNKSQSQRERALQQFRVGKVPILVATDIAARGIDVDDISHVINYDIPNEAESYVHRIGRTGRAGASGCAISLCDGSDEGRFLRDIEQLIRRKITVKTDHPTYTTPLKETMREDMPGRGNDRSSGKHRGGSGRDSRPAQRPVPVPHKSAFSHPVGGGVTRTSHSAPRATSHANHAPRANSHAIHAPAHKTTHAPRPFAQPHQAKTVVGRPAHSVPRPQAHVAAPTAKRHVTHPLKRANKPHGGGKFSSGQRSRG